MRTEVGILSICGVVLQRKNCCKA